jgi:rhamnosyltransferase
MTLYYPDINIDRLKKLASHLHTLFLLDNTPDSVHYVTGIENTNIVYIKYRHNYGLSKAFNLCLKNNVFNDDDYIIFFDQDSEVKEELIQTLINDYETLSNQGHKIGCIGPAYYETHQNKIMMPKLKKNIDSHVYAVKSIMTSAMLTTYKTLENVGWWNERIFLDLADWDLCWRLQQQGMLCCMTGNTVLTHTLGKSIRRVGFWTLKVGAPVREYYQTRDCLKLLGKSYTPFKFRLRFVLMLTLRPLLHMLFLPEKTLRLKYIVRGFHDFFRPEQQTGY